MRKINICLGVILAVLLVMLIVFLRGANLKASATMTTAEGWQYPELFDSIENVIASGSAPQQWKELPEDTHNLTLVEIRIDLKNGGMFPAEWLDIQIVPTQEDIAVYSVTGEGSTVPRHSSSEVSLRLITRDPYGKRTVKLNYYVYGMQRTITVRL